MNILVAPSLEGIAIGVAVAITSRLLLIFGFNRFIRWAARKGFDKPFWWIVGFNLAVSIWFGPAGIAAYGMLMSVRTERPNYHTRFNS
jgi:hypothetical protein